MDFMVHGSPTPRNHEGGIPGSARGRPGSGRPPSAKPTISRNPITVSACIITGTDFAIKLHMLP